MHCRKQLLLFFVFLSLCFHQLYAQNQAVFLNHQFNAEIERKLIAEGELFYSFKPVIFSDIQLNEYEKLKALPYFNTERKGKVSFLNRKFFHEHLIQLDSHGVKLTLDPLLNLEFGQEEREDPREIDLYKNMRGFRLRLDLGKYVSVMSSFRENQAHLPYYISRRIQLNSVAFGQGRVKTFNEGFDFNMASSRVVIKASDKFTFQFGSDKHFIGNGYRSFLLSDLAYNYPFLRIQSNWFKRRLKYDNLYTIFQDLERINTTVASEGLFERKLGAFHYLSYQMSENLTVSLFEGSIYPSLDTGGNIGVKANFYAPIIFLNTLLEARNVNGKSMQGFNWSYNVLRKLLLYGQFATQDLQLKTLSSQFGSKWFVSPSVMLQGELNMNSTTNNASLFTHYTERLTHPIGNDFTEALAGFYWQKNRWMSRLICNYIVQEDFDVSFLDARQSYLINPANNLTFSLGIQYRESNQVEVYQSPQNESIYIYVGLSTNFQNIYFNY